MGQSRAVVLVGRSDEGEAIECIAKLNSRLKNPPTEHLFEWLGCAIGKVLGITVPTPFQVEITEDFANSIGDGEVRRDAVNSIGTLFGCSEFDNATQFSPEAPLRGADLIQSAAELIAFDIFIHNADRRLTNHNLLVRRSEFVAFDHGDAFTFLVPVLFAPDPCEDPCESIVEQHVLRQALKGIPLPLQDFYDALSGLTDEVFEEIRAATPAEWQTGPAAGKLSEIINVLCMRRDAVRKWLPKVEQWIRR